MVAEFTDINRGMEKTGTFTMERKKLFQLVGKANSNLADVILKLGLFERYGLRSSLDFGLKLAEYRFLKPELLPHRVTGQNSVKHFILQYLL